MKRTHEYAVTHGKWTRFCNSLGEAIRLFEALRGRRELLIDGQLARQAS